MVTISGSFKMIPIRIMSKTISNWVATFDKPVKKLYFQKVKSGFVKCTDELKEKVIFDKKTMKVNNGAITIAAIYPFSLKK